MKEFYIFLLILSCYWYYRIDKVMVFIYIFIDIIILEVLGVMKVFFTRFIGIKK